MKASSVTHVEWTTTKPQELVDFLSGLFGWKFDPFGDNYFFYNPEPETGVSIGILDNDQAKPGGTPNVYIKVDSVDASFARAQELGGSIAVPKTEIPGMGAFGFVVSPEGNLIGMHEPLTP
jgi:predicted enzyme related to lactoylglutathione lyase